MLPSSLWHQLLRKLVNNGLCHLLTQVYQHNSASVLTHWTAGQVSTAGKNLCLSPPGNGNRRWFYCSYLCSLFTFLLHPGVKPAWSIFFLLFLLHLPVFFPSFSPASLSAFLLVSNSFIKDYCVLDSLLSAQDVLNFFWLPRKLKLLEMTHWFPPFQTY